MDFLLTVISWILELVLKLVALFWQPAFNKKYIKLFKKLRQQRGGIVKEGKAFGSPALEFNHHETLFRIRVIQNGPPNDATILLSVPNNDVFSLQYIILPKPVVKNPLIPNGKKIELGIPKFDRSFFIQTDIPDLSKKQLSPKAIQLIQNLPFFLIELGIREYSPELKKKHFFLKVKGQLDNLEDIEEFITIGLSLYDELIFSQVTQFISTDENDEYEYIADEDEDEDEIDSFSF